jgi:hypothetical protein
MFNINPSHPSHSSGPEGLSSTPAPSWEQVEKNPRIKGFPLSDIKPQFEKYFKQYFEKASVEEAVIVDTILSLIRHEARLKSFQKSKDAKKPYFQEIIQKEEEIVNKAKEALEKGQFKEAHELLHESYKTQLQRHITSVHHFQDETEKKIDEFFQTTFPSAQKEIETNDPLVMKTGSLYLTRQMNLEEAKATLKKLPKESSEHKQLSEKINLQEKTLATYEKRINKNSDLNELYKSIDQNKLIDLPENVDFSAPVSSRPVKSSNEFYLKVCIAKLLQWIIQCLNSLIYRTRSRKQPENPNDLLIKNLKERLDNNQEQCQQAYRELCTLCILGDPEAPQEIVNSASSEEREKGSAHARNLTAKKPVDDFTQDVGRARHVFQKENTIVLETNREKKPDLELEKLHQSVIQQLKELLNLSPDQGNTTAVEILARTLLSQSGITDAITHIFLETNDDGLIVSPSNAFKSEDDLTFTINKKDNNVVQIKISGQLGITNPTLVHETVTFIGTYHIEHELNIADPHKPEISSSKVSIDFKEQKTIVVYEESIRSQALQQIESEIKNPINIETFKGLTDELYQISLLADPQVDASHIQVKKDSDTKIPGETPFKFNSLIYSLTQLQTPNPTNEEQKEITYDLGRYEDPKTLDRETNWISTSKENQSIIQTAARKYVVKISEKDANRAPPNFKLSEDVYTDRLEAFMTTHNLLKDSATEHVIRILTNQTTLASEGLVLSNGLNPLTQKKYYIMPLAMEENSFSYNVKKLSNGHIQVINKQLWGINFTDRANHQLKMGQTISTYTIDVSDPHKPILIDSKLDWQTSRS